MSIRIQTIEWNGMAISIRHTVDAFGIGFDHLEIETVKPELAPNPISETGYKSHFLHQTAFHGHDAVSYVRASLDDAANSPEWQTHELSQRQLSLF